LYLNVITIFKLSDIIGLYNYTEFLSFKYNQFLG